MKLLRSVRSNDKMATKFTQKTDDGYIVETSCIDYYNKDIICFSVQAGCPNQCQFCYTGLHGKFYRNLTVDEIVEQIHNVSDLFFMHTKPLLLSAMGIGDVGGNLDNFIEAVRVLNEDYKDNKVRFALSTIGTNLGVFSRIKELQIEGIDCKVQVSLHSYSNKIRRELMPNCADIDALLGEIKAQRLNVEYNVVLFKGVNDSDEDAANIAKLLKRYGLLDYSTIKINKYNPVEGCKYKPSKRIEDFLTLLKGFGVKAEYYETNGSDIGGACGQMVGGYVK